MNTYIIYVFHIILCIYYFIIHSILPSLIPTSFPLNFPLFSSYYRLSALSSSLLPPKCAYTPSQDIPMLELGEY